MQNPEIIINDMCICSGYVEMQIPVGGSHVRQTTIIIRKFTGPPVVSANVTSPDSNGTMFSLWNVTIVDQPNNTLIKFTAQNVQVGLPDDFTYFVSYTITGQIA